jgi:hypothetical protein
LRVAATSPAALAAARSSEVLDAGVLLRDLDAEGGDKDKGGGGLEDDEAAAEDAGRVLGCGNIFFFLCPPVPPTSSILTFRSERLVSPVAGFLEDRMVFGEGPGRCWG